MPTPVDAKIGPSREGTCGERTDVKERTLESPSGIEVWGRVCVCGEQTDKRANVIYKDDFVGGSVS